MKFISATLVFLFDTAPTLVAVGGRYSNNWGRDCICLDSKVCRNKWHGNSYTKTPSD
ncbi:hypothetical protein COCSADRAFT_305292 [Bipolaris sorokiniana ND90Pr]|uniref:Uncharacterized protein n=1 Tax=Cochliobolus sativus (strain ND90Pr / ATCC 201652) TaxID=665912 RepID=M2T8Z9_COCSN|nr:uncharacterized protein COCSADRAFT_305292 [Bipolaris sorokiniana ND90Pr]EMD65417.1 hypothetical protein COCSADRAFT_305292 [Bipolaris sorokiniana ND90Pr]